MKSMKSIFKTLVALPVLTSIYLSAGAVHADFNNATVTNVLSKKIYVLGDGNNYTSVKPVVIAIAESLSANVNFIADAGLSGKVESWSIWLEIHKKSGSTTFPKIAFKEHSFSYSYPRNSRPKTVDRTETVVVPKSAFNALFTSQCNALAQNLRSQGLSDQEIFSEDRSIAFHIQAGASASFTGLDSLHHFVSADFSNQTAEIVCMKAPVTIVSADNLQLGSNITDSSLTIIEQSTLGGACKVNLSSVIKTNLPNTTVKYRFEHIDGNKSDIKTVKTDHSKSAMDAHWYDIKNDPNQSEVGSIRIIGVSHDFESNWKSYNISCNAAAPNDLALVTKPTVQLDLQPSNNIMYKGMICPSKIKVKVSLKSQQVFKGTGVLTMKNSNHSIATHDVILGAGHVWVENETFDLKPWNTVNSPISNAGGSNTWQTETGNGSSTVSQRFELRYALNKDNQNIVMTPYKTISVKCNMPQVNPNLLPSNNGEFTNQQTPNIERQETKKLKTAPKLKVVPIKKQSEPAKMQNVSLRIQTKINDFLGSSAYINIPEEFSVNVII